MSQPRGYGLNGKSIYTNVAKPMPTYLTFTVSPADAGGLGVTSVKSNGYVESVFMHTSQTPGVVNGITNPNPPSGYALVTFKTAFNYFIGHTWSQSVPLAGGALTSVTINLVYVITSVGTTTLAQWQAKGLPKGLTPAVGQVFVATATGALGGNGTVKVPGVPVVTSVTVVGDPATEITTSSIAQYAGAKIMLQFGGATASGDTTVVATAPASGTIFTMRFDYDGSSVTVDGI